MELSDRDRAILDFERSWWTRRGAKEEAIRRELRISGTRYYQLLGMLVDEPAAVAYDPLTVKRFRRDRDRRRRVKVEGREVRPR